SWGLAMTDHIDWVAIQERVSRILDQGMAVACECIARYRQDVERVAQTLLAQETILWDAMQDLWKHIPQGQLPSFPDPNAWTYYKPHTSAISSGIIHASLTAVKKKGRMEKRKGMGTERIRQRSIV
ncbi:MAG: hypothetical protein M1318_01295, partial [Firmicutes bacterium]|nr:hypothetical protein [Bacillota bacterium]